LRRVLSDRASQDALPHPTPMKLSLLLSLLCSLLCTLPIACKSGPDYGRPLPPGAPALLPLGPGEKHPSFAEQWSERQEILPALENSILWMKKPSSQRFFPIEGVTFERAQKSLERFREILLAAKNGADFEERLDSEFTVYKSAGWNAKGGGVLFTAYCTPILDGRLERSEEYRYPLYSLPPDLVKGPDGEILGRKTASGVEPYPTRRLIEATGMLEGQGLELAYLKDPLDAYIAHVNGSAFIRLENGELHRLGYSGKNGQPYVSLGQQLIKDKQLKRDEVSLSRIREWARKNPGKVEGYLARNESYVFFLPIDGNPRGSLNVPVIAARSLATDKTLFPRGAVTFVDTKSGTSGADVHDFLLDQDTGGAIRTAGRADIYLGIGEEAEQQAGHTKAEGQLYYLFLKEERPQP
jgi:membrane-bound lytic murein transglycosylase A